MANRNRKCRNCKEYSPVEEGRLINGGFYCSKSCVTEYSVTQGRKKIEKQKKAEIRERKEKIKSRSDHLREAQAAFNAFIRARDHDKPCISCGRHHNGQYHAGHYLTVGAHPEMRFDEMNCYKQCAPCNNHLSGNIVEYRKGLINRCGVGVVEYLEGPHEPMRITVDQIKQVKADYRHRAREMKKGKH